MQEASVQPHDHHAAQRYPASRPVLFYGWWIVLVGMVTLGIGTGTISYAYSVMVVPLEQEFGATRTAMMWGITACTFISGLLSPWLGAMADRRPMRVLLAAGALLLAAGFGALSFATAVWQVVLSYALFMSLALVLIGPLTASTLVTRWFKVRRGLALGVVMVGTSLGGFVFPPLLEFLIRAFQWRTACRLLALIVLLVAVPLCWLLVVDQPSDRGLYPDGAPGGEPSGGATETPTARLTTTAILRRKEFWLIAVPAGAMIAVPVALLANLVPYAVAEGMTRSEAAALVSVIAVSSMLGKLLFGAVADRVDLRLGFGVCVAFVCLALMMFRSGGAAWLLWSASFVMGLAGGGTLPTWTAMLAKAFGTANYGRVMGLLNLAVLPLVSLGSPLAGHIYDVTGSYRAVFEISTVSLVLATSLLAKLPPMGREAA